MKLQDSNILFSKFSQTAIARLQFVKNAAARLSTRTDRRSHVTLNLASLHRLPVNFRIDFKILLITLKALHGLAPACVSVLPKPDTAGHHPDFETTSILISWVRWVFGKTSRLFYDFKDCSGCCMFLCSNAFVWTSECLFRSGMHLPLSIWIFYFCMDVNALHFVTCV